MARHTCVQATSKSELIFNSETAQSSQVHDLSYLPVSLPKVNFQKGLLAMLSVVRFKLF